MPAKTKYQIRQHDRMSFWVKSREGNGEYLVDLTGLRGNGVCTCPHFRCRLEPKVLEDGNQRRCKHIIAVREHITDLLLAEMGKLDQDKGV
jgi:hypothetical protein